MRECLICGGQRIDGNEGIIYDYCEICLRTDLNELRKIHLEKEEASETREDHQEAPNG